MNRTIPEGAVYPNFDPDKHVTDVAPPATLPVLRANCTTLLAFLVKQVENGFTVMAEISYLDPETKDVKGVEQRNYVAGGPAELADVQHRVCREVEGYPGNCTPAENQLSMFESSRSYRDMIREMEVHSGLHPTMRMGNHGIPVDRAAHD